MQQHTVIIDNREKGIFDELKEEFEKVSNTTIGFEFLETESENYVIVNTNNIIRLIVSAKEMKYYISRINEIYSKNENKESIIMECEINPLLKVMEDELFVDKIDSNIQTLIAGDYVIVDSNDSAKAIIERKTWADYAASFKDGRHRNKSKLLKYREETGCDIWYIIEGTRKIKNDVKVQGIPVKNIKASLYNLRVNDGIFVMETSNGAHTAQELRFLAESYMKKEESSMMLKKGGEVISSTEAQTKCKLTDSEQIEKDVIDAWKKIKGVGEVTAGNIMKEITLKEFLSGEKTHSSIKHPATFQQLVTGFKGITTKLITDDITLESFLVGRPKGVGKVRYDKIILRLNFKKLNS